VRKKWPKMEFKDDKVEFKKGDQVIALRDMGSVIHKGDKGIFLSRKRPSSELADIRWDKIDKIHKHSCGGLCENGHGYFVPLSYIDIIRPMSNSTEGIKSVPSSTTNSIVEGKRRICWQRKED
jgi:hypothetical protein